MHSSTYIYTYIYIYIYLYSSFHLRAWEESLELGRSHASEDGTLLVVLCEGEVA